MCKALGYDEFEALAKEVDKRLEIGVFEKPKMTKAERKAANKAMAKGKAEGEKGESKKPLSATAAGIKRTADQAELDMPPDIAMQRAPGSVSENVSQLAV